MPQPHGPLVADPGGVRRVLEPGFPGQDLLRRGGTPVGGQRAGEDNGVVVRLIRAGAGARPATAKQVAPPSSPTQRPHVQADLGVDHDLLRGRQAVDLERGVEGTLRLTSASAIGPSSWCRAEVPTKPTTFSPSLSSAPDLGQPVLGAVEVQQGEPARRTAEGVHPGDRLLTAVAALVHVHGRADPADLVGDRAGVGVEAEPRLAARDPERLEGPEPAAGPAASAYVASGPAGTNS